MITNLSDFISQRSNKSIYLLEKMVLSDVEEALSDWKNQNIENCILIGGAAYSLLVEPRYTEDIDLLFMCPDDVPNIVSGFKRVRPSAFRHIKTHVEVEVLKPITINIEPKLVDIFFATSWDIDGIKVISPSSLIVSKFGRFNDKDKTDIINLINTFDIDLSPFDLSDTDMNKYKEMVERSNKSE